MSRIVRCSLIQASNAAPPDASLEATKLAMIDKHVGYIRMAAAEARRSSACKRSFMAHTFCAEQTTRWYDFTEPVPDGLPIRMMRDLARTLRVALIVPVYEIEQDGVYYNTAAVITTTSPTLANTARRTSPTWPRFLEKFYFRPGNSRLPRVRPGIRQDRRLHLLRRHFPEGARALGLNGAEIVFNPSATVAGLSEHWWKLEQPAHAVATATSSAPSIA